MYIILLLLLLAIIFTFYFAFNEEILCPPVVVSIMFFVCSFFGLFRYSDWNIGEYSISSVALILLGVISFGIFGLFSYHIYVPNNYEKSAKSDFYRRQSINAGNFYLFSAIILGIIADYLFLKYIRQTISSYGLNPNGISKFLLNYYQVKVWHSDVAPVGLTKYLGFLLNVNAVISLLIFLHNFCFKVISKSDYLHLLIVLLWIAHAILDSSRGTILLLLAQTIYCIYFFWNIYHGWGQNVNHKIIVWGIRAFIIMIAAFLVLAVVMGRRDSFADLDPTSYISKYMSSGVRNFDIFVQNPKFSDEFGKETFFSIKRFLYNYFNVGELYSNNLEYIHINGKLGTNVYTAFRRFYADFGITGIILFPGVLGFLYTFIFKIVKTQCIYGKISFLFVFFAYLSSELFFMPIEERFFTNDFSVNGIIKIILLFVIYNFVVARNYRIVFKTHCY